MTVLFNVLDVEKSYIVGSTPSGRWLVAPEPKRLKALDGVRLTVEEGDSIALVGESGSGKSTLVRLMLGLEDVSDGRIFYRQTDMRTMDRKARKLLAREVAFIYQDARGSMNPRMRIGHILAEPMLLHELCTTAEAGERVARLLERVGLPARFADRYPGELSGGQVRRVAVARALAAQPRVIIADESVAGLDVSVQAQLLNLLRGLCREMGLTLIFITHDLGVASYLCKRIAVMYLGRIIESGPTAAILNHPIHPYTRGLMRAFPSFGRPLNASLKGEIPSPINLPAGCRFSSRCPEVRERCHEADPALAAQAQDRQAACWFPLTAQLRPLTLST